MQCRLTAIAVDKCCYDLTRYLERGNAMSKSGRGNFPIHQRVQRPASLHKFASSSGRNSQPLGSLSIVPGRALETQLRDISTNVTPLCTVGSRLRGAVSLPLHVVCPVALSQRQDPAYAHRDREVLEGKRIQHAATPAAPSALLRTAAHQHAFASSG